jgi:hypothetical protein
MNHQKIYEEIIENAKKQNRKKLRKTNTKYVYYEKHHIFPKCLGGSDEEKNLVLLTAKEHYICHKLLTYIYKGDRKIALAFHKMTYSKNGTYIKSSSNYKYARELISLIPLSEETKNKIKQYKSNQKRNDKISKSLTGKLKSEEHKKAIRDANLGKKRPEWARKKMSDARKRLFESGYRMIISNETREKISKANSGKNNGMYGKKPWNAK